MLARISGTAANSSSVAFPGGISSALGKPSKGSMLYALFFPFPSDADAAAAGSAGAAAAASVGIYIVVHYTLKGV